MQRTGLASSPLWLSEHYWPGLSEELVLALAAGTAVASGQVGWRTTLVVPDQQTVLALFAARSAADVRTALQHAGTEADRVSAALLVAPRRTNH